jgi:ribonuclease P protein component
MPATPRQRLTGRRLRAAREFARLKVDGNRLALGCLVLNWAPASGRTTSRVGVITSRKVGHAVLRNRARRLLRESFRRIQFEIRNPTDLVLVARNSIVGRQQSEVDQNFRDALRRAGLLVRATPAVTGIGTPPS